MSSLAFVSRVASRPSLTRPRTHGTSRGTSVAVVRAEAKEVKVCVNKECKRMGSKKTLAMFQALGLEDVDIVEIMCLDECGMGPNVQINGDDGPIINSVKTEEDVKKVADGLMRFFHFHTQARAQCPLLPSTLLLLLQISPL